MSLDYDISKVNRDNWPDGGVPLFDFCFMMMLTGVNELRTDEDCAKLHKRAITLDSLKHFGWFHPDRKSDQYDMVSLIPLMKGIKTNVTRYPTSKFFEILKEAGLS